VALPEQLPARAPRSEERRSLKKVKHYRSLEVDSSKLGRGKSPTVPVGADFRRLGVPVFSTKIAIGVDHHGWTAF
jgi:hypothetical protein